MKSTIVKLIQFQFHPVPAEPTLKLILFHGPKKKTGGDPMVVQNIWSRISNAAFALRSDWMV